MIYITSKKRKIENIRKEFPSAYIFDVSSTSPEKLGRYLSPFYPHKGIPVPGSNLKAACVEAIWQGLKVFEHEDIDLSLFDNDTGKNLKRSVRKHGRVLGHRWLETGELLDYYSARLKIYLPAYWSMLTLVPNVRMALDFVREKFNQGDIVLLDYNVNDNFMDISSPLAHATLIKMFIERDGVFPSDLVHEKPLDAIASSKLKKQKQRERRRRIRETKNLVQKPLLDICPNKNS